MSTHWTDLLHITEDMTREKAAALYAQDLRTLPAASLRWRDINLAILRFWSPGGLSWIKRRAWQLHKAAR